MVHLRDVVGQRQSASHEEKRVVVIGVSGLGGCKVRLGWFVVFDESLMNIWLSPLGKGDTTLDGDDDNDDG